MLKGLMMKWRTYQITYIVLLIFTVCIPCISETLVWDGGPDGTATDWYDDNCWNPDRHPYFKFNRHVFWGAPYANRKVYAQESTILINGATVTFAELELKDNGHLTIDGPASTCIIQGLSPYSDPFEMGGALGSPSTLNILNGGSISFPAGYTLRLSRSFGGRITVDGVGSGFTTRNLEFTNPGSASLEILNGGQVYTQGHSYISYGSWDRCIVTVSGSGSMWTVGETIIVPTFSGGEGTLEIYDGAGVICEQLILEPQGHPDGTIPFGRVTVAGAGSTLTSHHLDLWPGYGGIAILEIRNGGRVNIDYGHVSPGVGGEARIEIDGADSELIVDTTFSVGTRDYLSLSQFILIGGTIRGTTDDSVLIASGSNAAITGPGNYDIKVVYRSDYDYGDSQTVSATFQPGCLTVGGAYDANQITPADFAGDTVPNLLPSSVFDVNFDGSFCGEFTIGIPYDKDEVDAIGVNNEESLLILSQTGPQTYEPLERVRVDTTDHIVYAKAETFGKFAVFAHKLYVLSVGVGDAATATNPLAGHIGAHHVRDAFEETVPVHYSDLLQLSITSSTNSAALEQAIERVKSQGNISSGDTFVFYINCHSDYDEPNDPWFQGDEPNVTLYNGDDSTGDERLALSSPNPSDRMSDDYFSSLFLDPVWEQVDKLFIMDTCLAGGYWGQIGGLDSGDLARLSRCGILYASPETHPSYYWYDSKGMLWGLLGQALVTALGSFESGSTITFKDLADASHDNLAKLVDEAGSGFAGEDGFIQGIEDEWGLPHEIEWTVGTAQSPDFSFVLGVQQYVTADLDNDDDVDAADFSILASHWSDDTCTAPDWCQGADLAPQIPDGVVGLPDLAVLAQHWLEGTAH